MKHVHLIGIGGTGLSAIARVLLESGYRVSGSDQQLSDLARRLQQAGVQVFAGHRAEQVYGADWVVRSSAIPDENVEVQAALAAGIPVYKRSDFLGKLLAERRVIAVAGSHGKTTTSAMLAWLLSELGQQPGFIVGGPVRNLDTNARAGQGPWFVIEADEYDYMFLGLDPEIAVVTNVEHDHPDLFPTPQVFQQAFSDFVARLKPGGLLLACGDDPGAVALLAQATAQGNRILTYGFDAPQLDYRGGALVPGSDQAGAAFNLHRGENFLGKVQLVIPGRHNASNALAALAVIDQLGLDMAAALQALASFSGAGRRFEILGQANGITIIDDYGHHPTEIRASLAAARARYPQAELWAVWQPHTYTRTKTLSADFAASFSQADHVIVTEVFRSREPIDPDFSALQVVRAMRHREAHYVPQLADAVAFLLARLRPGAVLLVFSAGDANQISAQVLAGLEAATG
ncbi:MAG: UDP-N-acetylmuramate--L-alanine ligase [Anaerolineales bacterium]|nr:UDP-N-acetylmuramate--L-alanine ligase [Anaerolineales bacterium]